MENSKEPQVLTLREFARLVGVVASLHLSPPARVRQMFRGLRTQDESQPAPYEAAITYLWTMDRSGDASNEVRNDVLGRIGGLLAANNLEPVAAELTLIKERLAYVGDKIADYTEKTTKRPKRDQFPSDDAYEEKLGEYEAFQEEYQSLEAYRDLLAAKRDLIFQGVDLYEIGWPLASLGRLDQTDAKTPELDARSRKYLRRFRNRVEKEIRRIMEHPDEPLYNITEPASPPLIMSCVGDIKRRLATNDGQPEEKALWKTLAGSDTPRGKQKRSEGKDEFSFVSRKLTERFNSPVIDFSVQASDDLDTLIAKYLLVVLTLDIVTPGWHQEETD